MIQNIAAGTSALCGNSPDCSSKVFERIRRKQNARAAAITGNRPEAMDKTHADDRAGLRAIFEICLEELAASDAYELNAVDTDEL